LSRTWEQVPGRGQEAIKELELFLELAPKAAPERKEAERHLAELSRGK
jgi:hypothetical protein